MACQQMSPISTRMSQQRSPAAWSPSFGRYCVNKVDGGRTQELGWFWKIFCHRTWVTMFLLGKSLQESAKIIQGVFFNWSALKMTKCQITCKSLQKSSKCQNFLRVWHLVIFRADQLKKPPCILCFSFQLCQLLTRKASN